MLRVLIVTSDGGSWDAFESALVRITGAVSSRSSSGGDGLNRITSGDLDMVVVDDKLEDMTGLEFAQRMVRVNPLVNLAAVSSLAPDEFHEATEGLGLLMQLPLRPGAADVVRLTRHLRTVMSLASGESG